MKKEDIKEIECKFITHLPKVPGVREDTHVVKEVIHLKDGTSKNNLRVITNFKRPFWVTKEPYRNHRDKKESEELKRVTEYKSTESDLATECSKRLGSRYVGNKDLRKVRDSPFIYGIDVNSKTYLKHLYQKKYPEATSSNIVATLDIEYDTVNKFISVISLSTNKKIFTVINKQLLLNSIESDKSLKNMNSKYSEKLHYLYNKHIPHTLRVELHGKLDKKKGDSIKSSNTGIGGNIISIDYNSDKDKTILDVVVNGKKNFVVMTDTIDGFSINSSEFVGITDDIEVEYLVVHNEMECISEVLARAHDWQPDFIAIWNISYDVPMMLDVCKKYGVDPADIFSDPSLPKNLRYFHWKMGMTQKLTASGKITPVDKEMQWHSVICPSMFYWIDAMSAHRYIRVGGKNVPGGYNLQNILNNELGSSLGKLYFKDEKSESLMGIEWHIYMAKYRPLEYTIYNQWDNLSILYMDDKTKDLQYVISLLSGVSSFDIFNSGPKRLVDGLNFFYLENGRVIGTKGSRKEDTKLLGLEDWIVLIPSNRIKDLGAELFPGSGIRTNIRKYTYDSDQVSGYPSNTEAANVSKDTTINEIASIEGIPLDVFRYQNINMLFGPINSIEYCSTMLKLPTVREVKKKLTEMSREELDAIAA